MKKYFNKKKEKPTNGLIIAVEKNQLKSKVFYSVILTIVSITAILCLIPPLWILLSAFKDTSEFIDIPQSFFPKSISLQKIVDVWKLTDFKSAYLSSLLLVLGELAFSLIVNGLAGYVISRVKPKGIGVFATLVMVTMMMPGGIRMVPLFMTFIDFPLTHWNMSDTYLPMWLMAGANAYTVLLFKSFFDSISQAYLEAARVDGCTNLGIFMKIIMPMSKPVFTTVGISTANGAWGSFFWPYLMLKTPTKKPVGVVVFGLKNSMSTDIYMMSLIFVIIVPVIIFLCFQKHIMDGFALGGVKE